MKTGYQNTMPLFDLKPSYRRDNNAEEVAAENAAMDAILTTEAGARG